MPQAAKPAISSGVDDRSQALMLKAALAMLFTMMLSVSAQFKIPMPPDGVPQTLQTLVVAVAAMGLGMTVGWNKLWGVTHLVFWTPAVVLFIRRWGQIDKKSIYGVWFVAALATMIVSLVFDAKDIVEYLMGV